MRFILTSIVLFFVFHIPPTSAACGSGWSEPLVPDYICFDKYGGYEISCKKSTLKAILTANSFFGMVERAERFIKKPQRVNFKGACQTHDNCYETKGKEKATCDTDFYEDLKTACREQVKDSLKAYKACIDKALLYNDVVRGQAGGHTDYDLKVLGVNVKKIPVSGCKAYIKAQKKEGVKNPSCVASTPCSCPAETPNHTDSTNVASNESNPNEESASISNSTNNDSSKIRIDWPSELKVSCDSKTPAHTNVVFSIHGLEENKNYSFFSQNISKKNSSRFYRHISQHRDSKPEIMFKNLYAGKHKAEVWFKKNSIKDERLIASKTFTIIRPKPTLTAPAKVAENSPFKVSLSNAISSNRHSMRLTIAPKHYPLGDYISGVGKGGIRNCTLVEHTVKGLSSGIYEIRLIQGPASNYKLLKKQTIIVGR